MNIDGYYDCLLGLFDRGVEEGFIRNSARNIVISAKTAQELIEKMEVHLHTLATLNFPKFYNKLVLSVLEHGKMFVPPIESQN